jgi:hypothetical protein
MKNAPCGARLHLARRATLRCRQDAVAPREARESGDRTSTAATRKTLTSTVVAQRRFRTWTACPQGPVRDFSVCAGARPKRSLPGLPHCVARWRALFSSDFLLLLTYWYVSSQTHGPRPTSAAERAPGARRGCAGGPSRVAYCQRVLRARRRSCLQLYVFARAPRLSSLDAMASVPPQPAGASARLAQTHGPRSTSAAERALGARRGCAGGPSRVAYCQRALRARRGSCLQLYVFARAPRLSSLDAMASAPPRSVGATARLAPR